MDSTRRPFDRSLSKEPGLKKPRLNENQSASDRDRSFHVRPGYAERQRPQSSNSAALAQRDRVSESSDSLRAPSGHLLHAELINQYKNALLELTFNSKPIITNLTIIAGENLHAAKAIAATVCSHILEVPKEQKLPSLYLLDSIVKNIGEDYIKYFAPRLPEVFCKAYRQVDPSIHQGMHHLFGTWKGVFPQQTLQMIEKELRFATAANGSSAGATTLRQNTQTQHSAVQAHSIHVNPKYLEARQRLPPTSSRGSAGGISGAIANSHEKVEALGRMTSAKVHQRDQGNQSSSVREKVSSMPYLDSEYGSSVSGHSEIGPGRINKKIREQEFDRTWYDSGGDAISEKLPKQKDSFSMKRVESYAEHPSRKGPSVVTKSWKNSEEEEFTWYDLKARTMGHSSTQSADSLYKDTRSPNYQKDFHSHQQSLRMLNDREPSIDDVDLADFVPTRSGAEMSKAQMPSRNFMDYSGEYIMDSDEPLSTTERGLLQSRLESPSNGSQNLSIRRAAISQPEDSVAQLRQDSASSKRSAAQQRSTSASLSVRNLKQQANKFERNKSSAGLPSDPRRLHDLRISSSSEKILQDPLTLSSQDVHGSNSQRSKPQILRSSSSAIHSSLQQKKHAPSTQLTKAESSKLEASSDGRNIFSSQIAGSESHSLKSSSDYIKHPAVDSPSQSINSSSKLVFREGELGQPSEAAQLQFSGDPPSVLPEHPVLSPSRPSSSFHGVEVEEIPSSVNSSGNQVSSLLSSLVAKGLISGSNSDAILSSSTQKPNQPLPVHHLASSSASASDSSLQVTKGEVLLQVANEPSSDFAREKCAVERKSLIGVEFMSDVIRTLHPDVLAELISELPHQCATCGIRLKHLNSVAKHMEWHVIREDTPLKRDWYPDLFKWIDGIGHSLAEGSTSSPVGEVQCFDSMVPADENQSACILCGNLFECVYSLERNEWMFKGTKFLSIPTEGSSEMSVESNSARLGPIVHVDCESEDFIRSLAMHLDVKQEKSA